MIARVQRKISVTIEAEVIGYDQKKKEVQCSHHFLLKIIRTNAIENNILVA